MRLNPNLNNKRLPVFTRAFHAQSLIRLHPGRDINFKLCFIRQAHMFRCPNTGLNKIYAKTILFLTPLRTTTSPAIRWNAVFIKVSLCSLTRRSLLFLCVFTPSCFFNRAFFLLFRAFIGAAWHRFPAIINPPHIIRRAHLRIPKDLKSGNNIFKFCFSNFISQITIRMIEQSKFMIRTAHLLATCCHVYSQNLIKLAQGKPLHTKNTEINLDLT